MTPRLGRDVAGVSEDDDVPAVDPARVSRARAVARVDRGRRASAEDDRGGARVAAGTTASVDAMRDDDERVALSRRQSDDARRGTHARGDDARDGENARERSGASVGDVERRWRRESAQTGASMSTDARSGRRWMRRCRDVFDDEDDD